MFEPDRPFAPVFPREIPEEVALSEPDPSELSELVEDDEPWLAPEAPEPIDELPQFGPLEESA